MNLPNPQPPMMSGKDKFVRALRKAVATFIFAGVGGVVGNPIIGANVAAWKPVAFAGLGAVLNLLYRWSERVSAEPQ